MRKEALEKLKEKARKWDRVNSIAESNDCESICPFTASCEGEGSCLVVTLILTVEGDS